MAPLDFFYPEKLLKYPSLEFEVTGALEKGAYPARIASMPEFAALNRGVTPRVGEVFSARVEKVAPQWIICLLRSGVYSVAERKCFESDDLRRGSIIDVEVETIRPDHDRLTPIMLRPCAQTPNKETPESRFEDATAESNEEPNELEPIEPEKALREVQVRDGRFKSIVREAFGGRCVICGAVFASEEWDFSQAAHIVPRAERGPDELENALCLCPLHHLAFDQFLLTIGEDRRIEVAKFAQDEAGAALGFKQLHGAMISFPENIAFPNLALHKHREQFRLAQCHVQDALPTTTLAARNDPPT